MIRKLVVASATVVAAAGLGLAAPAHAQDQLVEVTCDGPTFGGKTNNVVVGDVLAAVGADILTELVHDQSSRNFTYTCGDGAVRNVGNTDVVVQRTRTAPPWKHWRR
jgi:hypothetical protein